MGNAVPGLWRNIYSFVAVPRYSIGGSCHTDVVQHGEQDEGVADPIQYT